MLYAILVGGEWYIAKEVNASKYGEPRDPPHEFGLASDTKV